jgi:pimeloyl-ACP methyl ester carboxylesterase
MQPIYEFGGKGQVINLALANGFPPATYIPVMQPLTQTHHVICVQPRALWGTEQPPTQLWNWRDTLAKDLLNGLREHNLQDIIVVGHSFGGIASIFAVLEDPSRFKALILLDPTIFSPEISTALEAMQKDGSIEQFPLAARALRRQRLFASTEEAFQYFRSRPLFADWSDEVVRLYAEQGTVPVEGGVMLRWSPEWESYYFKTGYTRIWEDLPKLRGLLPTLIIRGGNSDTYLGESAEKVKAILPEAVHLEIAGHGHLFPQSNPGETHQMMRDWIANL